MKTLSPEALKLLKKIHEEGLEILWSFGKPKAFYGSYPDGDEMPQSEWLLANQELWQVETKQEVVQTSPSKKFVSRYGIENGRYYRRKFAVTGEAEYLLETLIGEVVNSPDQILEEKLEIASGAIEGVANKVWHSDYLIRERLEKDDWFEEHIGLLDSYRLTTLALGLLE